MLFKQIILLFVIFTTLTSATVLMNRRLHNSKYLTALKRAKRQLDLSLAAEHDDKETEVALEAIANLWRSKSGKTQVDGSAKVVHRSNSLQNGKTRYSARVHLRHDYTKRK